MLQSVKKLGLVLSSVTVQGPNGPVEVFPRPDAPIAVFQLEGWDPAPSPEAAEDEAQGMKVLDGMEAVGNAMADGQTSASEFGQVTMSMQLPGGQWAAIAAPLAEGVISDLQDDGKVNGSGLKAFGASLVGGLLQALGR